MATTSTRSISFVMILYYTCFCACLCSVTNAFLTSPSSVHVNVPRVALTQLKLKEGGQTDTGTDTGATSEVPNPTSLLPALLSKFQGDFDNYHQVYSDRQEGMLPRQGGGHEHFHVTLIPINIRSLPNSLFPVPVEEKNEDRCGAVIAAYYFDGMPSRIFRLRVYTLYCDENESGGESDRDDDAESVKMKLFTCDPSLEGMLRSKSESAVEDWADIIEKYVSESKSKEGQMMFQEMERCDILWTRKPDAIRHKYLESFPPPATEDMGISDSDPDPDPVHAIMVNDHEKGGVLLESQMMPGSYIRVQDELSLWENELWINDRGHDAESGDMVYGNWNGVPYQMTRVSRINSSLEREVVDESISWTMGEAWRSEAEYESKMAAIGGISTKMNRPSGNNKKNVSNTS